MNIAGNYKNCLPGRIKLLLFFLCLIVSAFYVRHVDAGSLAINRAWTGDEGGNETTEFSPGSKIMVYAEVTSNNNKSVSASGEIVGSKESSKKGRKGKKWKVKLKKKKLETNETTTVSWSAVINKNAGIDSTAIVNIKAKAGKTVKEGKITISILKETEPTPTPASTPSPTTTVTPTPTPETTPIPPSTTPPNITITNPADGSRNVSTTPNIEITYSDTDSGINTSTLVIKIDSVDYTSSFNITSTKASFQVTTPFDSTHIITASISDNNGNNASASSTFAVPDSIVPIIEPPELDTTVSTTMGSGTEFLYTGENPVQTGVGTDTIQAYRCAVLRGMVKDSDGSPIKGVTVTILDHEEFGSTTTRVDGMFDMAVNGGGLLTVKYEKDGYLSVQRQGDAPWEDYAWLADVVMVPADPKVTTIGLSASTEMQVAQGSAINDEDGTRTATLFFPQGVTAEMTLPGSTTQALDTLNVRITEYTVGDTGPKKMPAALPPQSGYTYCVEYGVDEAEAADAKNVSFDKPLIHYVENFLDFPVGMAVPVGYYDKEKGQWIPSDNGRIVKIMSITGGKADIDTDGDNTADNGVGTADDGGDMGITDEERTSLASLYTTGKSLWRVPIYHFSPWDCNWPYGPPTGATPPNQEPPRINDKKDPDTGCGSTIGIQKQTLGEEVGITGTPFSLHYQSNRTPGCLVDYSLNIPLSGTSTPASLKSIELEVTVAGRKFTENFVPAPNLTHTFTWDGMDGYGRTMQGRKPVTVRTGYTYQAVYQEPANFQQSFAALSGVAITGSRARQEVTLWQEWKGALLGHGTI